MLQLDNKTPFVANLGLVPDEAGIDTLYPALKATFEIGECLRIAPQQQPVVLADEYLGEPGLSSLKAASEVMPLKPATDVLLIGSAYAPGSVEAVRVEVTLEVAGRKKSLVAVGDRQWHNGFFGYRPTDPIPFRTLPLVYENAYGGADVSRKDQQPLACEANPIGKGFYHSKGQRPADGLALPNLELAGETIKRPENRPGPGCFAPLCSHWPPRLNFAGTYDKAWQETRAPYLPEDFDPHFYNVAPEDQIFTPYLAGGEQIVATNASPGGRISITLPLIELKTTLVFEDGPTDAPMKLETVVIEPDVTRLTLMWKGKVPCDKKALKMKVARFEMARVPSGIEGF